MRQGPIQVEPRERREDRSGRLLPLWEQQAASGTVAEPPWRPLDGLDSTGWRTVLQGARSVVVACSSHHPPWMEEVVAWSTQMAGVRTYLLGPEPWISSAGLQSLVKAGASRLLTRLGAEPPADWIVADRERGWLLLGAPGEGRRWVLPLDAALARSLHEAFVHLFWHQTRHESSPEGRFRDCPPSPFPTPPEAVRSLERGQLMPGAEREDPLLPDAELIVEPGEPRGSERPRLLLTPPRADGFARLAEQVGRGGEVAWFDAGLPRLALTRRRMVVELGEGVSRLRLEFGADEAIRMKNALELRARSGAWCFHPARALRDVRGPVWLEGASAGQTVQDTLPIDLGEVRAEVLLTLEDVVPASWREPSALARCLHYQWRVVPPRPPSGARPARLLREWEALDTSVDKRANDAVARLERMEREEKERGLLSRLTGLVSLWRDVGGRRGRLRLALDGIREQPLSRRPADAAELLGVLVAQEAALTELERFCRQKEDEEELRLAEAEQRADHTRRLEQARQRLEQRARELEACRARLRLERDALPGLEARVQARTEEGSRIAHEARTRQAREKRTAFQEQLEAQERHHVEAQEALKALPADAPKEERKRLKGEAHKREEAVKRLRQDVETQRGLAEAPWRPGVEQPAPDEELAGLKEQTRTSRQRITALEQDEKRGQEELEACARELDLPFQFQPPARPGRPLRTQEAVHKPLPVPKEFPPEVGELLEHGDQRYLAVRTWEEASRAKADAERLGAQLVAVPSVT